VATVLPKEIEPLLADTRLFVPNIVGGSRSADGLAIAREGLTAQRRIRFRYTSERGDATERTVRPLGVFFWGRTWSLAAWCEMRVAFRNFRLDRVSDAALLDRFEEEPGRTLRDLLAQYGPDAVKLLDR
jgi:predicted DNA-binding transcriptional regulator YafY